MRHMSRKTAKLPTLYPWHCNRCGNAWYGRSATPPQACANKECRSIYWNKARVFPIRKRR